MTTLELQQYYANLLILQYVGKPRAYQTIIALVAGPVMDQLPTQVNNAFVVGDTNIDGVLYPGAVGAQLDILGKYTGVTRTGSDIAGNPITLNDADFTQLIKLAAVTNSSGSSLATIQHLLHTFFPNEMFVFDGADMQMSYLISASVGNQSLIELFITEGLLPKPMGVELSVTYIPFVSLFGEQDYNSVAPTWDITADYSFGQRAQGTTGTVYASQTNNNIGHDPTSDTVNWIPLIYPENDYSTYPTYFPYTYLSYQDGVIIT